MLAKYQGHSHWPTQATNLNVEAEGCLNEEAEHVQAPPIEEQDAVIKGTSDSRGTTSSIGVDFDRRREGETSTSEESAYDSGVELRACRSLEVRGLCCLAWCGTGLEMPCWVLEQRTE
ncbi:hypothetical protein NDU88_007362 [Pleurodeles waltl]|uniref:Uncharacterized protein n=1 Tax=Pleurodeles waltl TaxID=8319 RepID=A0AAV7QPJ8_PLEWA|nr:hypothetical protein NDU88_007362 [Pleurodeles waltl]